MGYYWPLLICLIASVLLFGAYFLKDEGQRVPSVLAPAPLNEEAAAERAVSEGEKED